MDRRSFIKSSGVAAAAVSAGLTAEAAVAAPKFPAVSSPAIVKGTRELAFGTAVPLSPSSGIDWGIT